MSGIDLSSCPGRKQADGNGEEGNSSQLDHLIDGLNDDLNKCCSPSQKGKQIPSAVMKHFEEISKYYNLSKTFLTAEQQKTLEGKINNLSGRITSLTGRITSLKREEYGLWHYLSYILSYLSAFISYLNPFIYFYSKTEPSDETNNSSPESDQPAGNSAIGTQSASQALGEGDKESSANAINAQLYKINEGIHALEDSFETIRTSLLPNKELSVLGDLITNVQQDLDSYRLEFLTAKKRLCGFSQDSEIWVRINHIETSISGFQDDIASAIEELKNRSHNEGCSSGVQDETFISSKAGLKNFGNTCYVNAFLKTCLPYFIFLKNKALTRRERESDEELASRIANNKLTRREHESDEEWASRNAKHKITRWERESDKEWASRNALRNTLIALADQLLSPNYESSSVEKLLKEFLDNPLLEQEIPKYKQYFLNFCLNTCYDMGDARAVLIKVFELVEIVVDPSMSIGMHSIREEIDGERRWTRDDGRGTSIALQGESSIQQMIFDYSAPAILQDWKPDEKTPVPVKKTNLLVADPLNLPNRLIFTTDAAPEPGKIKIKNFSFDDVVVPIHSSDGVPLGQMTMQLESVACNIPNSHFFGYAREGYDTWTKHDDTTVTSKLRKQDIFSQISYYGCQFNYKTIRFIPVT